MNIERKYERCLKAYRSFWNKTETWAKSINSLLEKKNHCIIIVSLFNEMITYVNQQIEEKSAKMLKCIWQESAIIMT